MSNSSKYRFCPGYEALEFRIEEGLAWCRDYLAGLGWNVREIKRDSAGVRGNTEINDRVMVEVDYLRQIDASRQLETIEVLSELPEPWMELIDVGYIQNMRASQIAAHFNVDHRDVAPWFRFMYRHLIIQLRGRRYLKVSDLKSINPTGFTAIWEREDGTKIALLDQYQKICGKVFDKKAA